jgi:hypothetical protein
VEPPWLASRCLRSACPRLRRISSNGSTKPQPRRELRPQGARASAASSTAGIRTWDRAHRETNLPIFTHTGIPGKAALEQLDILEDVGVKPQRVVIGHLGNLVDANVQVHKAIMVDNPRRFLAFVPKKRRPTYASR